MSENLENAGGTPFLGAHGKPFEEERGREKERVARNLGGFGSQFDDIRDEKYTERFTSD